MILNKIDDPRDALQKATRFQLSEFARSIGQFNFNFNGVAFQADLAPANVTRAYLRSIGKTNIRVVAPALGSSGRAPESTGGNVTQVNADADLARQFASQTAPAPTAEPPLSEMGINELRKICQGYGIKLGRQANKQSMRELIEAHRNGQDAA